MIQGPKITAQLFTAIQLFYNWIGLQSKNFETSSLLKIRLNYRPNVTIIYNFKWKNFISEETGVTKREVLQFWVNKPFKYNIRL